MSSVFLVTQNNTALLLIGYVLIKKWAFYLYRRWGASGVLGAVHTKDLPYYTPICYIRVWYGRVWSAETDDIAGLTHGNMLSSMVHVRLHSPLSSKLELWWSPYASVKNRRPLFAPFLRWKKLRIKLVLLQLIIRSKLQTNPYGRQKHVSTRQRSRQMLCFLCQNLLPSLHRDSLVCLPLLYHVQFNEFLVLPYWS